MAFQSIARTSRCFSPASTVPLHSQRRFLSISAALGVIGPESPRYIEVPASLQTRNEASKPVKGILPVPRKILSKRREYKATPEWLAQVTPEPASNIDLERVPLHLRKRTEYKKRMAEMRRSNLREGITELYDRVVETEQQTNTAKERQYLRDSRALNARERHDEEWTNMSVSKAIRDALKKNTTHKKQSDTERLKNKLEADTRVQSRLDDRLQSLHSLYLHAKDFIINEKQLEDEIEKVFGSEEVPMTWTGGRKSVWTLGQPAGTKDMIGLQSSMEQTLSLQTDEVNQKMKERMMRIAGKLTGGKIPIPEADEARNWEQEKAMR